MLVNATDRLIIDKPWLALGGIFVLTCLLALFLPRFQLDASADSLLLEDDQDLRYYSSIVARYGSENFLVITYTAKDDLFDDATLKDLTALRNELRDIPTVDSVISMLDVPLIDSPRQSLTDLQKKVPTLESPETVRELARIELRESPIYSNLLMSPDGQTTALLVKFSADPEYARMQSERDALREKLFTTGLSPAQEAQVDELSLQMQELRRELTDIQQQDIARVRAILAGHKQYAITYVGGLPMIVSDMIDYIENDIAVFGGGIAALLVLLLSLIFMRVRWVVISLLCCFVSVIMMSGLLGLMRWPVTVVSSNFIALMLIFSLSLTVHLIQRYRELHIENPDADQRWLVRTALYDKARPCLFTAVTTMVGFASLLVSGIRPVIDFGWMMVIGMLAVLLTAFILFPACLMLLTPGRPHDKGDATRSLTGVFARMADRHAGLTALLCVGLAVGSLAGIARLQVENRFVDYFKETTEIYQSLITIDQNLGGTAPLDIIIDADAAFLADLQGQAAASDNVDDQFADEFSDDFEDDFGDEFGDEFADEFGEESTVAGGSKDLGATSYWYNTFRLKRLREVHDYLDSLPETGKVLSMATTLETLEILNQDETPGTFFLSVLYNRVPETIKSALFDPYMSADGNQVRVSVRVFESDPELRRDKLIKEIRQHLVEEMNFEPDQVRVTGMLVMYNNVLQSLYRSQILTLGVVFVSIMVMFGLLFRSLKIALTAVLPSILAVGMILGVMGLFGIPLDIMTITIAAVSVGIGVDDAIHYVHRYRQELMADGDAIAAMHRSHASVGRAMYYTSLIVIAGFSILALSNFIPSILFGLLTGFAMFLALAANLTLLPLLLRWWNVR
ncbi:MAG: efflux RND transporter permease subunit [Gammaproteobacteria bacterium]